MPKIRCACPARAVAASEAVRFGRPVSPDEVPEYLTIVDAARVAGLSVRTLRRWVREGRIPSDVAPDGTLVIRRSELIERVVTMNPPVPREE
jgi:excisionase family DNA binding protein